MSEILRRKLAHIEKCISDKEADRKSSGFEDIRLIHRALPETDFDSVDTSVRFLGKKLSFPFMISSITGGSDPEIIRINRNLAAAAEKCKVAMSVGSQRIMFTDRDAEASFMLREYAPSVPLIGNLGAVQLNYGFGIDECIRAVETMDGDALFLHLNPLQEIIQKNGNRNFSDLCEKIRKIRAELPVPLMIKETGCGLSTSDFALLRDCGIKYIDVSGRGGTSWSRIEYMCSGDTDSPGLMFQDWGLTASESLLQAEKYRKDLFLIAGGGIRSGTDIAKAMVLGAGMGSAALPFLEAAMKSAEEVVKIIEKFHIQFKITMFLLGTRKASDLVGNSDLRIKND